ncbi:MAG: uroporphyrinogen decarboxylase family protein [Thermodesulfobacteriota bacterium]|nr:uroporphyrinogen decarboxylase family protein [Thermodesulfobacteriota bacterium]
MSGEKVGGMSLQSTIGSNVVFVDKLDQSERMMALMANQGLDRVPVMPFALGYTAKISGMTLKEFYMQPEKAFRAQGLAAELHGYDGTGPSYMFLDWEGWEFGGEMKFPESYKQGGPTLAKSPVEKPEDVENLRMPNPRTSTNAVPLFLQAGRMLREMGFPATLSIGSPTNAAAAIVGKDKMLRWYLKEPELVHAVMRKATDFILATAHYFIDEFGSENCAATEGLPLDSNLLISSQTFKKFSYPYIKEIHERLLAKGVNSFFIHLCGDHTANLPYWRDIPLPPRSVISIGSQTDIEATAKAFGENHIVAGNVPTSVLQTGSPEDVMEACRVCIEKGKDLPGGFILMPECEMPPLAPPVNVHAMLKAAREYGAYETVGVK